MAKSDPRKLEGKRYCLILVGMACNACVGVRVSKYWLLKKI